MVNICESVQRVHKREGVGDHCMLFYKKKIKTILMLITDNTYILCSLLKFTNSKFDRICSTLAKCCVSVRHPCLVHFHGWAMEHFVEFKTWFDFFTRRSSIAHKTPKRLFESF